METGTFISTELLVSGVGALVAILIAVGSAILAHKNNVKFENRKLKQEHYIRYIEAVHNLATRDGAPVRNAKVIEEYTFARDKMLIIGKSDVIQKLLAYENEGVGKCSEKHDEYLTYLIKEMRKDLGLKNKNLPILGLKRS